MMDANLENMALIERVELLSRAITHLNNGTEQDKDIALYWIAEITETALNQPSAIRVMRANLRPEL